ncbi:meiotically up-regulated protein 113 family protein [Clostridioides difficile CD160]|nr:meiotically up-regulated protein 113 family protein [Clostridioides difficile CD160]
MEFISDKLDFGGGKLRIEMEEGYVYILRNDSLKGLLKIGSTTFGAEKRAKQLSNNTAIPTPFIVVYEIYVRHYEEFEKTIHKKLASYRVNTKREFFAVSIDKVIELMNYEKEKSYYKADDKYSAIEILPKLVAKYGIHINPDIVSARIYQEIDRVYFEYTKYKYRADYLKDQIIIRIDLQFITNDMDENDKIFKETVSIETNVDRFIRLDDISMANCVGDIFIKEWLPI